MLIIRVRDDGNNRSKRNAKSNNNNNNNNKGRKKNKLGGSYSKMTTNFANIDRTTASSKCI